MTERYIAITYDVCKHHDLYENMNKYILNSSTEIDKQVKEFAKKRRCSSNQSL